MTIETFLATASQQLKAAGIATARLDCLVLLEDVLNTNRTQILAHPERQITEVNERTLKQMMQQRAQHIPLAYIRGKTEFYGREFAITHQVLEPRPESETMISLLAGLSDTPDQIVDIGTGSGALAITAKLELPASQVYATDIDPNCLQLARRNAERLSADITFVCGDLLEPLSELKLDKPTILLCNLPYVPDDFQINTAALHEPRRAIYGGSDGLNLYRRLFEQLAAILPANRYVLCESLPSQHTSLQQLAAAHGYNLRQTDDFIQLFAKGRAS